MAERERLAAIQKYVDSLVRKGKPTDPEGARFLHTSSSCADILSALGQPEEQEKDTVRGGTTLKY
jgi:hypothetical protein